MKILYGVQATGNGHLSRAREMAKNFTNCNIEVDYLISGRPKHKLHDMDIFGDYLYREGLTFQTDNGHLQVIKTAMKIKLIRFLIDLNKLNLDGYDLILSDFEPVTAWAAKLNGKNCIGIGHQYAFNESIPKVPGRWISSQLMRHFAPAQTQLGLHWHNFNSKVLPPIVDPALKVKKTRKKKKIVVYLPFENQKSITRLLAELSDYEFYQYAPQLTDENEDNIHLRAPSVKGFHQDLEDCDGVVCNTGFELISECLQLGIPVLTTPLSGQVEQLSNAVALTKLGLADVVTELSLKNLSSWLKQKTFGSTVNYPDVAKAIVDWITQGQSKPISALAESLWANCSGRKQKAF